MSEIGKISEMTHIPSERGREYFLEEKWREKARRIDHIAIDVRDLEGRVAPDFLRIYPEYTELRHLLNEATKLAANSGNSALARDEFLKWEAEGNLSELGRAWERLCDAKPAILCAQKRRRWMLWRIVGVAVCAEIWRFLAAGY